MRFKVGDIVTPNIEMLEKHFVSHTSSIMEAVGKNYKVESVNQDGSIRLSMEDGFSPNGWLPEFWQLSKSAIIHQILSEI